MQPWLVGVLVTVVSAFFSTTGLLMQKYAHMKEAELMKKSGGTKGYVKCCGIPCNLWFVSGFIVLAFVPLPLDFIALSNAGQSLIIPVGTGMTIVWNQILSPLVLKEKFSRQDAFSTVIIVIGVLVSTLFGTHASPSYPASVLIGFVAEPAFIVLLVFAVFSTAFALSILHINRIKQNFSPEIQLLAVGYAPAVFGSMQIMCFKVVGELNKNTFQGVKVIEESTVNGTLVQVEKVVVVNEFTSWRIYTFLLLVIILAIYQFKYMNLGLSLHHAIRYLPIYNTFLLIASVVVGSVFFQEYATFHPIAFPIGCVLLIIGIRQLAHQQMARVDPMLLTPDSNVLTDKKTLSGNPKVPIENEDALPLTALAASPFHALKANTSGHDTNASTPNRPRGSLEEDFNFDSNFDQEKGADFLLPHEDGFTPAVSDSIKKDSSNALLSNMEELTPIKNGIHLGGSKVVSDQLRPNQSDGTDRLLRTL